MLSKLASRRIALSLFIAVFIAGVVLIQSGGVSHAGREPAMPLPTITATKAVTFTAGPTGDVDGDGKADPGDTITYTVTVNNTAAPGAGNDATGVSITDTLQNITTLTAGTVQVSPIVGADSYSVTGNVRIQPNAAAGLKVNDIDPVTGNSTSLTVTAGTATSAQCVVATCPVNNVTINADGSFSYDPPPGFEGTDTFTYTVTNAGGGTATGTVTMTVGGMIWFVNNNAAGCATLANGCGRLTKPFSSLANFQAINNGATGTSLNPAINDNIFVFESASVYTGGVTLLSGQKLIGQDSTSTLISITTLTLAPNSDALPVMNTGGNATTILNAGGNAVTLGSGNTINGFTTGNSSGPGVSGASFGTVTINNVIINSTGQALALLTGTVAGNGFTSTTSTGGIDNVSLNAVAGTVNLGTGALSGATPSPSFAITGGTCSVNYSGNITQSNNVTMVLVQSTHTTGTVTFSGTLTASNGNGLQFSDADGTYNFNGTTTLTNGARIDILSGSSGTFGFAAATSVTNGGGMASFNVGASNPTVTYSGSISTNTLRPVSISNAAAAACGTITFQTGSITSTAGADAILVNNCNSGTINFNDPTISLTTTTNNGVTLTTNTGATVNFTPVVGGNGLDISTTSGAGFTATGGGTVNITGSGNTINATSGTALNVANTTIGASNLTFHDISSGNNTAAADPANGIVLNNTGATGHLTVTGDGNTAVGGNNSGGVIQHTTSHGISLTTTNSPSFTNMSIHDVARNGVDGIGVVNFTFANGQVTNAGTGAAGQFEENGIAFVDRTTPNPAANTLTGVVSITGSLVSGPHRNALMLETWGNGTISNINVSSNTFSGPSAAAALKDATLATTGTIADAIHVLSQGSAATTSHITTGTINSNTISGFEFLSGGIFIGGNGIRVAGGSGNSANNTVATLGAAATPIEIGSNDVDNVGSNAIAVSFNGQQGLSNFNIHNNGTGANPMSNAEGLGISVFFGGSGTFSALVNNNAIDNNGPTVNAGSSGIAVQADDGPAGLGTSNGVSNITVNNNVVTNPDGFGLRGIVRASNAVLNLKMQNNTVGTPSAANREAIRVDSGSAAGNTALCMNLSGNTGPAAGNLVGSGVDAGIGVRKQGTVAATNAFKISGIPQANPTNAQVQAFVGNPLNKTADGTGGSVNGVDIISGSNYGQCTLPFFASPFTDEGATGTPDSQMTLSFLDMPYPIGAIQPLFDFSEHTQPVTPAEIVSISSSTETPETAETTVAAGASEGGELVGTSYWDSASGVLASVAEFVDKFKSSIEPTVYAQKDGTPKDNTPTTTQSGETITVNGGGPGFTLPAGKSMTITFKATVDNGPYAAGINNITNSATVTAAGGINVTTNTTSLALDAAPDLSITAADGGVTTQPGGVQVYALTYKNGNTTHGQDATGVTISNTVPTNTTFNLASSGTGWSCADGAIAGTVCTNTIGPVTANNTTAIKNFAVKVLDALPAGVIQISNTATIAEVPANTNGTDLNPGDNTGNDATNIIGNWLGGTSIDWNTAANWSNATIPPSGNNISVPTSGNQPTLVSADVTVGNLTLGGQSVTINSGRILNTTGVVTLGANSVNGADTLSMGATSTITRTTGQVNSVLNKAFAGPGSFTYPVGTTTALAGFSPVDVTVTAGAGSLSVKANTGTAPPLIAANTLHRFWDLTGSGITADVTWHYLDGDVFGTEANYRVIRIPSSGTPITVPNSPGCPATGTCVNPAANTFTVHGLQNFSVWTAGANLVTAAKVAISGRVVRPDGMMAVRSLVSITDDHGNVRYAKTNPFGYFRFQNVETGQGYLINVIDKQFEFAPQFVSVTDNMGDLVLTLERRP